MKFVLFKCAAAKPVHVSNQAVSPIKSAIKALHNQFKNMSPFSAKEIAGLDNPSTLASLLGRIGIRPPYNDEEKVAKKINTFKDSGGHGLADIRSPSASRYVGEPGYYDSISKEDYISAIEKADVENNPRYAPRTYKKKEQRKTFCNVYTTDVMRSLGIPLPHVVDKNGNPVPFGTDGAVELGASGTVLWLKKHGNRYGWQQSNAEGAQAAANSGGVSIVITGTGKHVAIVRPGMVTDRGAAIAQAGARLYQDAHVADGFGDDLFKSGTLEYWINNSKSRYTDLTK